MKKLIIFFSIVLLFGVNVKYVKKELKSTKNTIYKMNLKLAKLAKKINQKQRDIYNINKQINILNKQIKTLKALLQNSNIQLSELQDLKNGDIQKLNDIKEKIYSFLSTNYYISNKSIDNVNDLINEELTKQILKQYSNKIASFSKEAMSFQIQINLISNKINNILKQQKLLKQKKQQLLFLKQKREKELKNLAKQKQIYKNILYSMIKKQQTLQKKLKELSIIKTTKITSNLPTKTYRGVKTIAPVEGKVIKRFGSYIDPIYKFKVYNESITIKPYRDNALIRAIMPGKVVYIDKKRGVLILRHKNYLFSIYANLSQISPILKKGSYVKRGQIIARVKENLEFEITYKDRPINPLKVISLR